LPEFASTFPLTHTLQYYGMEYSVAGNQRFSVEEWEDTHPCWHKMMRLAKAHGQTEWVLFHAEWHIASYVLVALHADQLAGFIRFVDQPIGPDMDCPAVLADGRRLHEAKILAFAVDHQFRNRGYGRELQRAVIRRARELDCYQVRSHTDGAHNANHQLKLSMGYGIHPIVRGDDNRGAYFVMPLHAQTDIFAEDA
jgi:GNAT superfamily N-acetyltransferase